MVASPANPTGTALSREELAALATEVHSRNGHLLVDEIYHGLGYDAVTPSVLEVDNDAFVINSFSKYFGMTGWRLGWLVAPEAAVREMEKLAQNLFISMSTMAQYAALAAFEPATREILDERRDLFRQRRDYLLPAVQELGFSVPCKPEGAFYIYADASRFTDDSQAFCMQLLEEHGVALTPGIDFGHHLANRHLRFSYTTSMDRLELAVERLAGGAGLMQFEGLMGRAFIASLQTFPGRCGVARGRTDHCTLSQYRGDDRLCRARQPCLVVHQ